MASTFSAVEAGVAGFFSYTSFSPSLSVLSAGHDPKHPTRLSSGCLHSKLPRRSSSAAGEVSSCACGKGKFQDPRNPQPDTPEGKCEDCMNLNLPKGVKCKDTVGLTLATLPLKDGYWRSFKEVQKATADDKHWSKRLKTKAKILTSFYQIVSKLPSTLAVQYPDFYRGFTTAISSVFNFNAIGLVSVGCFLPRSMYSFYGSFLTTTITPIVLSLILLLVTIKQKRNLDPYEANQLTSSHFSLFYGFTYLISASTSTMAFTTFFCTTYGDDKTEYFIADRGIDCNSDSHKNFKLLSIFMILPFQKTEENTLAQISTVSIFLTLLAGILIILKESLSKEFSTQLGALLVIVNTLVFAFVGAGVLFKPIFKIIAKCNEKHIHDAPLKNIRPEVAYSVDLFIQYVRRLTESDASEAGWKPLDVKDWSGKKKKVKEWLDATKAKAEWRCADGDGPLDQARVKFVVDADAETVVSEIDGINEHHNMNVGSLVYVVAQGKDWRQVYRAIRLPWHLRQRDLVYTEHTRREQGGDIIVCSRSSKGLNESTNELSIKAGRLRADLRFACFRLRPIEGSKTEITYLVDIDLGGSFVIGYLHKHMAQNYLKGVVDMRRKFAEASKRVGVVSEPPPPLPIFPKALAAAANPMFAGSRNTDSSVEDRLNIEMGRMIKKKAGKADDDEDDIVVL
ncbi:hypothetical protein TrLO_g3423 [Triparma laevis f. longispina]|uniref:START domain-containing protein n=1 Tax=Triparma laevis f. longispina TaxID=1714387 RepID=A0A9W7CF03_9STRA|nr:hypothetical protein TrLO_g3423 [Triparma laevis f. longispina]